MILTQTHGRQVGTRIHHIVFYRHRHYVMYPLLIPFANDLRFGDHGKTGVALFCTLAPSSCRRPWECTGASVGCGSRVEIHRARISVGALPYEAIEAPADMPGDQTGEPC